MKPLIFLTTACLMASPCLADLQVQFREGAPKDRFTVTNKGACTIESAQITIDLSGSTGGLIFDVTEAGSGVEVFQPFVVVAGSKHFVSLPEVKDGDQIVSLNLADFGANKSIAFTIDVDDTAGAREITVSGSEMQGATVTAVLGSQKYSTVFGEIPEMILETVECSS